VIALKYSYFKLVFNYIRKGFQKGDFNLPKLSHHSVLSPNMFSWLCKKWSSWFHNIFTNYKQYTILKWKEVDYFWLHFLQIVIMVGCDKKHNKHSSLFPFFLAYFYFLHFFLPLQHLFNAILMHILWMHFHIYIYIKGYLILKLAWMWQ